MPAWGAGGGGASCLTLLILLDVCHVLSRFSCPLGTAMFSHMRQPPPICTSNLQLREDRVTAQLRGNPELNPFWFSVFTTQPPLLVGMRVRVNALFSPTAVGGD